ncbi:MAG: MFS transporter [Polyangiales bacterium]
MTDRSPWSVLAVCAIAVFLASLDGTVMYVAFQDMHRTYADVSAADLSWVINGYTIAYAALLVPAGRLADRYGRRRFFLGGTALFTLASFLCGVAPSAGLLVFARVLQAVGAAILLPASLALVLAAFPPERRASAVATWGAVGGLAAAIGPSLGSVVIEKLGWEWVFFINLPLGVLAIVQGRRLLAEARTDAALGVPDPFGIALLVAGMSAAAFAVVKGADWGVRDARTLASGIAALVMLALFVVRARRVADPAVDVRLFLDARFSYANAATFVFGIAFVVMFFGNVFFLTQQWHYSLREAGLAITPGPLTVIPFAMLGGRIADRHGHRNVLVVGGLLYALSGLWFVLGVHHAPDFWGEWLPRAILSGAAVGLVLPSLSGAAVANLPRQSFAVGGAINQAMRQFGSVLGVAIAIAILGEEGAHVDADAFEQSYAVLIVGGILTALLSLPLGRKTLLIAAPATAQAAPER